MPHFDEHLSTLSGRSRFQDFEVLMSVRVENIILVSSLYDKFILQEDGQLSEVMLGEFLDLHLHHTTGMAHVSSGSEALALASGSSRFNLIITALNVGDMDACDLARAVKEQELDIPVVVLAYDAGELATFMAHHDTSDIDRMFLWQGDARILLAIVKYMEDRLNVTRDTEVAGVQVILVVEDSIRYYSSFLPMIFSEVIQQSQRLIPEGINLAHKILRMRARPKILLCTTFEEAWEYFMTYEEDVLGIISDIEFPHHGELDPMAGVEFARMVKAAWPDVPIVLQSGRPQNEALAREVGATFLLKGSQTLINDLRDLMVEQFAFGDFIFRNPEGIEISRACDLRTLQEALTTLPIESLLYHAGRNDFSRWLKARTEFALAHRLRPRKLPQFPDAETMRRDLIDTIVDYRRERGLTLVADFDCDTFDTTSSFSRIGGGSLGGKARALAFVRHLLNTFEMYTRFPGIQVTVPPSVVLGTDVFDEFLERNDLQEFAIHADSDEAICERFLAASLTPEVVRDLTSFLKLIRYPLAVRSSSLLEDSQYHPMAGVYSTFMLPNDHPDLAVRIHQLETTIKRIYASTFSQHAKQYLDATPYRLEEEKMAVIVQKVVGAAHGPRFYPDISGVARSYNFYPSPPMEAEDGIVAVALGLGRTVVEGDRAQSFCPRYPRHVLSAATIKDVLQSSQRDFWALGLGDADDGTDPKPWEHRLGLDVAEADGTLSLVASTYSPENDALYDGISRPGVRLVTFAPILKFDLFPLAEIVGMLLEIGSRGMGAPVEIEFAVGVSGRAGLPKEFGFLQMRPMSLSKELVEFDLADIPSETLLSSSTSILGNGEVHNIHDIVVVDHDRFDRARSREVAREIAQLNAELSRQARPYVLIGVGRWGSADPWLGIPVTWDEIAGARVIVESELEDIVVAPSQGSHFFQNLTSFGVGYFTVSRDAGGGFVDWTWLAEQPAALEREFVRHLTFAEPLVVKMDGKARQGIILKPGAGSEHT